MRIKAAMQERDQIDSADLVDCQPSLADLFEDLSEQGVAEFGPAQLGQGCRRKSTRPSQSATRGFSPKNRDASGRRAWARSRLASAGLTA